MDKINSSPIVIDSYEPKLLLSFLPTVYIWFSLGLLITTFTSVFLYITGLSQIFLVQPIFAILLISQMAMIIALPLVINRTNAILSALIFLLYSFVSGITFTVIFYIYTATSIFAVFAVAAVMFGTMAVYGYLTKQDLTRHGNIAIMGLIGIIFSTIINLFLQSDLFDIILSYIGVMVFLVLIAWDMQKLKSLASYVELNEENFNKLAISGALTLYLDFINLFLHLLRILGGRRK